MSDESVIWRGSPSQILNFWHFAVCLVIDLAFVVAAVMVSPFFLIGSVIPLLYVAWRFMVIRCQIFELTSQRLRMFEGVLNQDIDEIELYRVKDTTISRPFLLRLFGLSQISLETSDRSHPTVILPAIPDGLTVRELIREHVEIVRDQKRVREVDFDNADGDDMEFGDEIG